MFKLNLKNNYNNVWIILLKPYLIYKLFYKWECLLFSFRVSVKQVFEDRGVGIGHHVLPGGCTGGGVSAEETAFKAVTAKAAIRRIIFVFIMQFAIFAEKSGRSKAKYELGDKKHPPSTFSQ